ncbi:hypothetical protein E4U45_005360 [Claviceps purpurea]|nr:hypothetical protein E4U45_005360 [Claviceps purpurea]
MAVVCGDWKRLCSGKRGVAEEGLEGYYHDFAQYSHRWDSVLAGDWRVASPSGLGTVGGVTCKRGLEKFVSQVILSSRELKWNYGPGAFSKLTNGAEGAKTVVAVVDGGS